MQNPLHQWQTLVTEASHECKIALPENLESYLVFMLMRFIDDPQIAHNVMALEYLASSTKVGAQKIQTLRNIGDQCLIYSGLFPERARRRRVRVSYYVQLGQSAYVTLAKQLSHSEGPLFKSLAQKFVTLMDILQSMRELEGTVTILDPMLAQEIWHDTGSAHALKVLGHYTKSPASNIINLDILTRKH